MIRLHLKTTDKPVNSCEMLSLNKCSISLVDTDNVQIIDNGDSKITSMLVNGKVKITIHNQSRLGLLVKSRIKMFGVF